MCCLVEKEISPKSELSYFQHRRGFQKRAEEYVGKRLPGIVYGKLVRSNTGYLVAGDKQLVLIAAPEATDIASEFHTLTSQWKTETIAASSLSDIFTHPAYQRIMAMGKPALPFILRDLQQNSGHWFHALRFIVGKDIAAGTETVSGARSAWLAWGYKNGYL